jgi:MinD superfamily P-loop ATPase
MKELVVISGKGGTGKTSLLAAFASLAEDKVLCDADVDAADLHLIVDPTIEERHDFWSGHTAHIDPDKCTGCGLCREVCRFAAVSESYVIDPIACEGCGVCHYFCPAGAVDFPENLSGEWYISGTRFGPMAHASLGIAEENSGKLVSLIRREGKRLAEKNNLNLLLTDGPPGIGCPVIASIGGATAVLIVSEPTVSGRHDMERVSDLAAFFKIPAMVCVNKFDLNPGQGEAIENFARQKGISVMGRIPFDPVFTRAMVQGRTIFEYDGRSEGSAAVRTLWGKVSEKLGICQ